MAAAAQFVDPVTGLSASGGGTQYKPEPTNIQSTSTSGGRTDNTTGTQAQSGISSQVTSSLNTTPQALQALHTLISTLTDRPAISDEELNAKAPKTVPTFVNGQWMSLDPLTGRYVSPKDAQVLDTQRQAQRIELQKNSGVIEGGTVQQRQTQAARNTEIGRDREQQGKYSKEAAMGDAQSLINKSIADALRVAMPQITAASEGAGTSKSTFRAQATQEAATRGGIEGAALGANLSVQYGQIFNQLGGILENLTKQDPNGPAGMLLQALNVAKGISQTGGTTGTSSGTTKSQGQTQQGPQTTTENKDIKYQQPGNAPSGLPQEYVPPPVGFQQPVQNSYYAFSPGTSNSAGSDTFDSGQAYADVVGE